ncbi:uncharacterized protein Dvir_GJ26533 [Drosophila virilis]|uniref:Uncharacterized protein n=1 Tax=Drosophila virilis TaxID=7244 RepID=A0A0Q9WRA6_DROVI|nr:uncharacterized protein Dvir_GJ26533 [Drosophila virilis]
MNSRTEHQLKLSCRRLQILDTMKIKVAFFLVFTTIALASGFRTPDCPHWSKCWKDYQSGRVVY